jgi:2-methylisocitrate lyase-like PEP mutase family enzyme
MDAGSCIQFVHMPLPDLEQKKKARAFLAMHCGGDPLLLPNVWDVASARIVEEAGFPALATTSAGVAFSLGYPDGQKIHKDRMMAAVARIAQAVKVPVSADLESGYGSDPDGAAKTARAVIVSGAIGINLEDATGDPERPLLDLSLQLEKIRAIRSAADKLDVALVINARTDVYLLQVGEPSSRYEETIRRLNAYRDAGADCVFAPGLKDVTTIKRLVADLKCPVNILAGPGSPSVQELQALGVARVSLGSGPMRAALGTLRRIAEELKTSGTYELLADAPTYSDMNQLLKTEAES